MILDGDLTFTGPIITNSATRVACADTAVKDAGAAIFLFGSYRQASLRYTATFGATTATADTLHLELIGSASETLSLAAAYEVLASTGVRNIDDNGTLLVAGAGSTIRGSVPIKPQKHAWQYYGLVGTLAGADSDVSAVTGYVVLGPQTNMA